jgi:geranylgeranyl reductase family protein
MKKFDVVVVGAGTAGCMAAKTMADAGLEVCLIDRKKKGEIGNKICGDAIGRHHFDSLGLDYPSGKELERRMVGVTVHSPDMETVVHVKGEGLYGFIVNRLLFGQRLLRDAINAGATLLESTQAVEPIIKDNFVTGVVVKDLTSKNKAKLNAKVVVEASGFSAVLRKKLPIEIGIERNVDPRDVAICYREIRELTEPIAEPEYCAIFFNQKFAPGAYYWIFPEGETKVNVGLGASMSKDFPNPKNQLYNHVLSQPMFKGSSVTSGGGGYVPTRRPLDCMVGNGIIIVGDAACQVNPIHGGGMGPSMMGGALAGDTIVEAVERRDVSREGLWLYNARYMQSYGAKQAGLDVFRMLLQKLSDDDLNYGMKYRLVTGEDALKASMGADLHLNITEATRRIFRGLRKVSLLKRLRRTASLLRKAKAHYRDYPTSPKDFDAWRKKTQELFEKASG